METVKKGWRSVDPYKEVVSDEGSSSWATLLMFILFFSGSIVYIAITVRDYENRPLTKTATIFATQRNDKIALPFTCLYPEGCTVWGSGAYSTTVVDEIKLGTNMQANERRVIEVPLSSPALMIHPPDITRYLLYFLMNCDQHQPCPYGFQCAAVLWFTNQGFMDGCYPKFGVVGFFEDDVGNKFEYEFYEAGTTVINGRELPIVDFRSPLRFQINRFHNPYAEIKSGTTLNSVLYCNGSLGEGLWNSNLAQVGAFMEVGQDLEYSKKGGVPALVGTILGFVTGAFSASAIAFTVLKWMRNRCAGYKPTPTKDVPL